MRNGSSKRSSKRLQRGGSLDIKRKLFQGISWNVLSQLGTQGISFCVTLVLARLLVPEDFGLVALSGVFVGFILIFEDLAMGSAIVQRKNIDDVYLSTSFWASMMTGLILAAVLLLIAPFAALFYDNPLLKPIIMISSLSLVISPFTSIHKSLLTKRLEFNKLAIINIVRALFNGIASVLLAFFGYGVWSLVLGGVISGILVAPLVWSFSPWRPSFKFSQQCFKDLFGFSSYLLSFNVFNYFARNFDNLIIGKLLGAQVLGVYSIAYSLMMKPIRQVSWSIGRVLFPVFSDIQHDKARVRSGYLKVTKTIALVTFPMMFGLLVVAKEFVLVTLGAKWQEVILPLQLLCLVGATQSVGTTVGTIFNSQGRSDLLFKTGVAASLGHVLAFVIGIRWGLVGMINCYIGSNAIFFFVNQFFAGRLIELPLNTFLKNLTVPLLCSSVMAVLVMLLKSAIQSSLHLPMLPTLALSVATGVVSYMTLVFFALKKTEILEFKAAILGRS